MKAIKTRYGASVDIQVSLDDDEAVSASLYVGLESDTPVITKTALFSEDVADLSLLPAETQVPLNTYKYQINVVYNDGRIRKFPEPSTCGASLPDFIIEEALDETEVLS